MSHAPESLPNAASPLESPPSTKDRLLDAALEVLAERGLDATTVRAVTQVAGVSVSAANYHFGSMDALLREALRRRLGPMNERRLERLALACRDGAPTVEAVVEAFLQPSLELRAAEGEDSITYRRLPGWLHLGSPERSGDLVEEIFGELFERFVEGLGRALPGRDRRDLALALHFALGALLHTTSGVADRFIDPDGSLDDGTLLERLVRFASDGVRASCPVVSGADGERS